MIASGDHISGLTAATVTVTISKAGGALAAPGGTVAEIGQGWYRIALTTTDTNTLGDLAFHATAPLADPTDFIDEVVGFNFTGTDALLLNFSANTIVSGQAIAGTLSTTQMTTNLQSTGVNQYINRVVIWTGGVNQNMGSLITAYNGAGLLSYNIVNQAPAASDSFIII